MPYSDDMPALVYPDTTEGRRLGAEAISGEPDTLRNKVYYCPAFIPKKMGDKTGCHSANYIGNMNHNLCYRCLCGFMFMNLHEREFNKKAIETRYDL